MLLRQSIYLTLTLLLSLNFLACSGPQSKAQETTNDSDPNKEELSKASEPGKLESTYDFPVYEKFAQFEKHLKPEDDRLYVINFWATWCKPCIEELPYFEEIRQNYKSDQIEVLLVSLDAGKQIPRRLVPFLEKHQLKSPVVVLDDPDFNSWIDKVSPEWSGAIPASVFIKGDQLKFFEQSFTLEELRNTVNSML